MNPRLQSCVEEYLEEEFTTNRMLIEASISKLSEINLSDIPADLEKKISSSKDSAESVFDKLESVKNAKEILESATTAYASLHTEVRDIQRKLAN